MPRHGASAKRFRQLLGGPISRSPVRRHNNDARRRSHDNHLHHRARVRRRPLGSPLPSRAGAGTRRSGANYHCAHQAIDGRRSRGKGERGWVTFSRDCFFSLRTWRRGRPSGRPPRPQGNPPPSLSPPILCHRTALSLARSLPPPPPRFRTHPPPPGFFSRPSSLNETTNEIMMGSGNSTATPTQSWTRARRGSPCSWTTARVRATRWRRTRRL